MNNFTKLPDTVVLDEATPSLEIIDQTLLPGELKIINLTSQTDILHEELYERCPSYKTMVDLQQLEEEGGNS